MTKALRMAGLAVAALVMAGCATMTVNTITNLTASRLPRKDNGQYMFSVEFYSRQRTVIEETMKAEVIIGNQTYAMERTPLVASRWETLVPVPEGQRLVNYRYRFHYDYKAIPEIQSTSMDSKDYQLQIVESW